MTTPGTGFDNIHRAAAIQDPDFVKAAMTQAAANLSRTHLVVPPTTAVVPATLAAMFLVLAVINFHNQLGLWLMDLYAAGQRSRIGRGNKTGGYKQNGTGDRGRKFRKSGKHFSSLLTEPPAPC